MKNAWLGSVLLALLLSGGAHADNLDLVRAARAQVGVTTLYDGSYRVLAYPGGDVPLERGVCTDVIVRAFRVARSMDLQQRVHEDMRANFAAYPSRRRWGLSRPDANIDHRRVPNLAVFFERAGYAAAVSRDTSAYLPGDIVTWDLGGGIPHIGIVSERRATGGVPFIIHNIGAGAREEDLLFRYAITGHFRPAMP
jgi:uncharacterized protein YijF (DUF1287 family)